MIAVPKTVHPPFLNLVNAGRGALFDFNREYRSQIGIDCVSGPFHRLKFPGVVAFVQSPSIKEKIAGVLPLIEEVNRHLTPESKTRLLVFYRSPSGFSLTEASYNRRFHCIYGFEDVLEFDDYSRPAVFHELAHSAYHYYISDSSKIDLGQLHMRLDVYSSILYKDSIPIKLLSESNYSNIREYNDIAGDPCRSPNELFASTSTILRFFHSEFFDKVSAVDKATSDLFYAIAIGVSQAWGFAKLFADEVYARLGLPVPQNGRTNI